MEFKHRISNINITGLHGQFDANIDLNPGLNVIYGKNGMGKTTILHIIANALELDISRFTHLKFKEIKISNFGGNELNIKKNDAGIINLICDNQQVYLDEDFNILSDEDYEQLRNLFGKRSTYLPAFRSILERTRHDSIPSWRESEKAQTQYQEIYRREQKVINESDESTPYTQREEANAIARKTLQCRTWFGSFIPVIRYPSILDVEEGLDDEWRSARITLARKESKMYEEVFNKVLKNISTDYHLPQSKLSSEQTLKSIEDLLSKQSKEEFEGSVFSIEDIKWTTKTTNPSNKVQQNIQASVLNIYYEGLQNITAERAKAFIGIKNFEESVSKFLENKKLTIGSTEAKNRPARYVSIISNQGHRYGLNALSSGEKQIITMLFSASRSKFHDGVFLIDEPELSLHIDWQRIILDEITKLAPERQIIACTHSPEVGGNHFSNAFFFSPSYYDAEPSGDLFDVED